MKKIIYFLSILLLASSCDVESLNVDKKNASEVPGSTLMSSAQLQLFKTLNTPNVNINNFRLYAQQWTEVTYIQEEQYKIQRQIPEQLWQALYRDVLKDFNEATKNISKQDIITDEDAGIQKNQLAIIELQNIITYQYLVDMFGDIPYTEALDIENVTPIYDDAQTIYLDLLTRLDNALENLDTNYGTNDFDEQDLIYHGNVSKWIAFANALKIKIGMTLADSNPTISVQAVNEGATNTFLTNDGNFALQYLGTLPNTNPIWENLVYSNRNDFAPSNTYIDKVNELEDPRRSIFFTDVKGEYIGGTYGSTVSYGSVSHLGATGKVFRDPELEGLILSAAEVNFYLAEAAARGGYNVSESTEKYYEDAITQSMLYWGVEQTDIDTYLANPKVAYATAEGDYKQKIGEQKWVILFNRGMEAWTEFRRLDYPKLVAPSSADINVVPTRMIYPRTEQNQNENNYNQASSSIGGDELTTKIFWDVN